MSFGIIFLEILGFDSTLANIYFKGTLALFIRLGNIISATLSIALALAMSKIRFYQYRKNMIILILSLSLL